jgi:hypothetical protein
MAPSLLEWPLWNSIRVIYVRKIHSSVEIYLPIKEFVSSLKVPEKYKKCLQVSSSVKRISLFTLPGGRKWATSQRANVEGDRMYPGIGILPLPSANILLGRRMSEGILSLWWETILEGGYTTSWPTAWRCWKENVNTTTLFYLKVLEILYQERRGQVNTLVMEQFNSILFHNSGSVNKQHTYQSNKRIVHMHMCTWIYVYNLPTEHYNNKTICYSGSLPLW